MVFESLPEPSIVLYGGSFDPPHQGHRALLQRTLEVLPRARLWVLPAPVPASTFQQPKQPTASFAQRLAMCRLAFADEVAGGRTQILDLEGQLPAPNYTEQTLEYCLAHFPQERWAILIGQDQLLNFAAWHKAGRILELADLLVVSRGDDRDLEELVRTMGSKLGLNLIKFSDGQYGWQNPRRSVYLMSGCLSDAASTEIRNNLNQTLQKGWLAPAVAEYIKTARLYGQ